MNTTLLRLLLSFMASVISVLLLFAFTQEWKTTNRFSRLFPPHALKSPKQFFLGYEGFYFAGETPSGIFLANRTAPSYLLRLSKLLDDTTVIHLHIPGDSQNIPAALSVVIDSPVVILSEGISPAILTGKLPDTMLSYQTPKGLGYFSRAFYMDSQKLAFLTYDTVDRKSTLTTLVAMHRLVNNKNILLKQIDGFFCVDGNMTYDDSSGKAVFVYLYRNEFIVMDSNLHIQYKGKTIDTNTRAKIKLGTYTAGKSATTTFSAPPQKINANVCIEGNRLFVHSLLQASNEKIKTFWHSSVIDIYNLSNGHYQYSFYVPDIDGKKLSYFSITGNDLYTIHGNKILKYTLNL